MSNVIQIEDPFFYITDDSSRKIVAVQWFKNNQYIEIGIDGKMNTLLKTNGNIQAHELRQLMTMWLALTYPDTLRVDDVEKENEIREETK